MSGLGAGVVEVNEIDSALVLYRRGKGRHGRGRGRGKGRSYEISTSENASLGDSQKVCHGLTSFFSKSPCILANSSCNFTPSILLSSFSNLTTGFLCIRNSLVIFSPRTSASSCQLPLGIPRGNYHFFSSFTRRRICKFIELPFIFWTRTSMKFNSRLVVNPRYLYQGFFSYQHSMSKLSYFNNGCLYIYYQKFFDIAIEV